MISMLTDDRVFLIVVNVFDGLFKGGLMLTSCELTAELGYPLGESLTSGLLNFLLMVFRYPLSVVMNAITFTVDYDPNKRN